MENPSAQSEPSFASLCQSAGPFAPADIKAAAELMHAQLEVAALRAQLAARELAVINLFSVLCRHSPELLPSEWSSLYDLVCAEERFWVYPSFNLGEIEDGVADAFTPYLNTERLHQEWDSLIDHASKVRDAQQSGRKLSLPA